MSFTNQQISEAQLFYEEKILGWMINDLKKSVDAQTNFLTALGCLIYTEVIGIFLPPLKNDIGKKKKEKRFYRCLFRLNSADYLINLDKEIRDQSDGRGIYAHLRHSMAHKYFPTIGKKKDSVYLYLPAVVARDGIRKTYPDGSTEKLPPIFFSSNSEVIISTKNFVTELEQAYYYFYNLSFLEREPIFLQSSVEGMSVVLRGKE